MLYLLLFVYILINIIFCRLSILLYKKLWNPIFVFCVMFLIGGTMIAFESSKSHESIIQDGLYWIIIGELLFLSSFFFTQMFRNIKTEKSYVKCYNNIGLNRLSNICVILSIIEVISVTSIVLKAADGDISKVFLESTLVRENYLERESLPTVIVIFQFLLSFNIYCLFCLLPFAIKAKTPNIIKKVIFIILLRLFGSVITMSKESFILTLVIFISANSMLASGLKEEIRFIKKYSIYFVLLFVFLIFITSYQRNYTATKYDNYFEAITGTIGGYIGAPLYGFCIVKSHPSQMLMGEQTFRPVVSVMNKLGFFSSKETDSKQQSISEIENLNVFTMFGNYYNDYGSWGIVFLSVFWGLFLGAIFSTKKTNQISKIVVNSIVMCVFILGFYDFLLIQTIYLLTMAYAVFFEKMFKKTLFLKRSFI